jgi:hypothetical protein
METTKERQRGDPPANFQPIKRPIYIQNRVDYDQGDKIVGKVRDTFSIIGIVSLIAFIGFTAGYFFK